MKRDPAMITTHEAADLLGMSYPTIRRWIKEGYLHVVQIGKNHWLYPADLLRCKAQRKPGRPKNGRQMSA